MDNKLKKDLGRRQMNMISIGGAIGAGLFFTSGNAVSQSGPGGAVTAYLIMGVLVYIIMISLVEISSAMPIPGAYTEYPRRFVSPEWAFGNGWSCWLGLAFTVTTEIVAASILMKYWFPNSSSTMWSMIFLTIMLGLNLLPIKGFGESEYWLSEIKVVAVIIFIIIGSLMIAGIINGNHMGFGNWTLSHENDKAPFINGAQGILSSFLVAGFSFCNVEMVAISAAESKDPGADVPKTISGVYLKILIFYIATLVIIGTLIPFSDARLLNTSLNNIASSPFVIIFNAAGFKAAASVMNVVIITALLTSGNASIYAASRMLFAMGENHLAPKYFAKVNKHNVPVRGVVVTVMIGCVAFFTSIIGEGKVYMAVYSLSGISCFINWLSLLLGQYRFRKAVLVQKVDLKKMPYVAKGFPYLQMAAIIMCIIVIFCANIWVFSDFNWFDFLTNYGLIPIFAALVIGYKKYHKTKIVKLEECDLSTILNNKMQ
ncbi:MAG: amino acid permease [Eubacteriaceae bacterium]|jgi:amino acid permease|nr:amino acid permease [Eubacteriaceae bacterium]